MSSETKNFKLKTNDSFSVLYLYFRTLYKIALTTSVYLSSTTFIFGVLTTKYVTHLRRAYISHYSFLERQIQY